MKLISMTDFVLEVGNPEQTDYEFANLVMAYANFLKQPLILGMFIPTDEDGNVLEEPLNYNEWCKKALNTSYDLDLSKYEQYQQAKERVLFEGCVIVSDTKDELIIELGDDWITFIKEHDLFQIGFNIPLKIEDISHLEPTLTPQALKQIGI